MIPFHLLFLILVYIAWFSNFLFVRDGTSHLYFNLTSVIYHITCHFCGVFGCSCNTLFDGF